MEQSRSVTSSEVELFQGAYTPRRQCDSSERLPIELLDLPNEILTHIFTFLDQLPPSSQRRLSKPEHNLTTSSYKPLKNLSITSKKIRCLVLPILFRHARLDPYYINPFLTFASYTDAGRQISTLTAQLQGPCNHIHPPWWSRVLEAFPNLGALTIQAAPHIFAEIGQVPIETSYNWAFKMPYHTITLERDLSSTKPTQLADDEPSTTTYAFSNNKQNLLTARSWTSLHINESSHLPAYSTYEYFLKIPPSLLTSLYHQVRLQTQAHDITSILHAPSFSWSADQFLRNLTSFSYTAIFPFYNHVDEILKCIRQMRQLRKLFLKLCPEPESNVLQDEMERNGANAGRTEGRIDVNDPWNEFETSYTLIPHTIIYLTTDGSLEEFQTDDVKMVGVRDTLIEDIDRRLDGLGCWSYAGDGIWRRDIGTHLWMESKSKIGGQISTAGEG